MRRWLVVALRAAITLAALLLAWRIGSTLSETPPTLRLRPLWLLAAFGLHLAILALLALRLGVMLKALAATPVPGFATRLRMTWGGLGLSQVALGSVSGDVLRVAMLAQGGRRWPEALRLILLDRLVGVAALGLLGAAALGFVLPGRSFAGLVLALALLAFGGLWGAAWAAGRPPQAGMRGQALRIACQVHQLVRQPAGWLCLGLALLSHGLSTVLFVVSGRAIGLEPPLVATLVAVPAGMLASMIPVSLGGWGLRELLIAATYRAIGATFDGAVPTSVVFGLTHVAMGLPGLVSVWSGFSAISQRQDHK